MKKKTIKTIFQALAILIVFGLFAGLLVFLNSSGTQTTEEEMDWQPELLGECSDQWEMAGEDEAMELWFQPSTTQLMLVDKRTGAVWRSNPENAGEDTIAFGQNKTLVQSLLNVEYVNDQSNFYTMNSFQGSVQESAYSYRYQDNGVRVNLMFPQVGFEIPCFFGIEDGTFVARILTQEILQHGVFQISKIALLPFWGAGGLEDEGYMVVPDGSGALIHYNNNKQNYQSYSQTLYGRNLALNLQSSIAVTESATMPIYGIKRNDQALLAVITQGAYQAQLSAEVSRKTTSNNTVYSSVLFVESENNTLLPNSSNEETVVMLSPQQMPQPYYEVRYFLLEEGAGYNRMATRYQQYLVEEKGMEVLEESQRAANLAFVGGVEVRKTLLGVPYQAVEALTPFEQLQEKVLALQETSQASLFVSMTELEKGGNRSKLPTKITYAGALGGQSAFRNMSEALEEAGIPFYPIYDPVTMSRTGNGYSTLDAIRNVSRALSPQYRYLLTSGARDTDTAAEYLISPMHVAQITDRLLTDAARKNVTRIGIAGLAEKVYADYRKDSIARNETGTIWEQALQHMEESAEELLLVGAYAYAFPYADVITDTPIYSSQFDVEDEAIPFYEIVMSGYAALYSEPLNLSGNVEEMLLQAVEYGVSPTFLLMTADAETLLETDLDHYYSISYENWQERIQEVLGRLEELEEVFGQRITEHRFLTDLVRAVTYEDGTTIYVNYGNEDVTVEGTLIPSMGFTRKGGR